jgi:hypothetical protein
LNRVGRSGVAAETLAITLGDEDAAVRQRGFSRDGRQDRRDGAPWRRLALINDDDFGITGGRTQIVIVKGTGIARR